MPEKRRPSSRKPRKQPEGPAPQHSFFQDVYDLVRLIPHGRVTSYGAIAACLGTRSSARMVGWAMNQCPPDVPAHRVLNRLGMLSGAAHFGPGRMEQLLNNEGIRVENEKVVDFEKHFWDPILELDKYFPT